MSLGGTPTTALVSATHAGNASQVSDGAAAVLLARRSVAQKLGLPILGKYVTSAVVGLGEGRLELGEGLLGDTSSDSIVRVDNNLLLLLSLGVGPLDLGVSALQKDRGVSPRRTSPSSTTSLEMSKIPSPPTVSPKPPRHRVLGSVHLTWALARYKKIASVSCSLGRGQSPP
jgi:hypothetical protein